MRCNTSIRLQKSPFFFLKFGFARRVASGAKRLKSSRGRFWKSSQCREIRLPVKLLMALSRCYNNPDVMVTLLKTNFHRYLIQLWWSLVVFPNLVHGDVVKAQTGEILILKPPSSHLKYNFRKQVTLSYIPRIASQG